VVIVLVLFVLLFIRFFEGMPGIFRQASLIFIYERGVIYTYFLYVFAFVFLKS
jgi:hypothetical protein